MNGRHKQEFNGFNACKVLPFLKELLVDNDRKVEKFPGLMENLILKSSTSTEKNFENVIFIDTPGLADGNLKYKFNIEEVLEWFSKRCDLVLTFFDPQGQALCRRTMSLIKHLYPQNQNKMHFVMTKGDIFDSDEDRLKCMC
jgi:predicted GTPase